MDKNEKAKSEQGIENSYKYKQELERLYQELVTELKILYRRAEYKNEEINVIRYRNAYKKLELIRERRHLTEIGKDGIHKEAYRTVLEMIKERYEENGKTIEDIVNGIEGLCEKFNIEEKDLGNQGKNNSDVER